MNSPLVISVLVLLSLAASAAEPARDIAPPSRFSVEHMDRSVDPGTDFYRYASGNWLKQNPVPPDKSSWDAFALVEERNLQLLQDIVETSARDTTAPAGSPARLVGDFYRSAVNTNRLEQLGFKPLATDFARIAGLRNKAALPLVLAELNLAGASPGMFGAAVEADDKNSSVYMFSLSQGGLGLPERDYYLADEFTKERAAYVKHIARMFRLAGEWESSAQKHAVTVLALETALAQASKSGVQLRDPLANYHPFTRAELAAQYPALRLGEFMTALGLDPVRAPRAVVRQPEFFATLNRLVQERSLSDWKTYLRWHVLNDAAHYLNAAADRESFSFYGSVLSGQPEQRPRWQRAVGVIDGALGEALGQLYVEKHYPPAARARMNELVENLKTVFRDRLKTAGWMAETTRAKALAKFDRFTQKIGSPEKFRDYSSVEIRPDDYFGNVRRAAQFDTLRELGRIGGPVDRTEWEMTPPTVNAYFNPLLNEIAFPAGILQPPFFDAGADDAVNYGAIGMVIGHEITHGYDDEGRQYDANGNLSDWWTEADAKEFLARAQKLIDQYDAYQALPGVKVNGKLTLGENIADLGGATIAYEALQRALAKDPSKRRLIDGFTPEQRFFLSFAQIWRVNQRDADLRQQVTANPHSPGQFRAVGPLLNLPEFYTAFGIKEGSPLWRAPASRASIW